MFVRKTSTTGTKIALLSFIAGAAVLGLQAPVIGIASADHPGAGVALAIELRDAPSHYRDGLEPPSPQSHIG